MAKLLDDCGENHQDVHIKLWNDDTVAFVNQYGQQYVYKLTDEELSRIYFWIEATGKY